MVHAQFQEQSLARTRHSVKPCQIDREKCHTSIVIYVPRDGLWGAEPCVLGAQDQDGWGGSTGNAAGPDEDKGQGNPSWRGLGGRKHGGLPENQTTQAPRPTLQDWMVVLEP